MILEWLQNLHFNHLPVILITMQLMPLLSILMLFYIKSLYFLSTDKKPNINKFDKAFWVDNLIKPNLVQTGLSIQNIPIFDFKKNTILINCIIWFRFNPSLVKIESLENFSFVNVINLEKKCLFSAIKDDQMFLKYEVQVEISSPLDHKLYPLNDHVIYLKLINIGLSTDEIMFDISDTSIQVNDDINIENLKIIGGSAESGYQEAFKIYGETKKNTMHPVVLFSIFFKKSGLRNLMLIIMPILLILFTSSANMLIYGTSASYDFSSALGFGISTLTLIMAYRYVIINIAPKVEYLTLAENVYNICLLFVFLNFIFLDGISFLDNKNLQSEILVSWHIISRPLPIFIIFYLLFIKDYNSSVTPSRLKLGKTQLPKNINLDNLKRCLSQIKKNYNFNLIYKYLFLRVNIFKQYSFYGFLEWINNCIPLHQEQEIFIDDYNEIYIVQDIKEHPEYLMKFLNDLVSNRVITKELEIVNSRDYIIFNQISVINIKQWISILIIQTILSKKNPGRVIVLQSPSPINKSLQEKKIWINTPQTYSKYQSFFNELILKYYEALPTQIRIFSKHKEIMLGISFKNANFSANMGAIITPIHNIEFYPHEKNIFDTLEKNGVIHWHMESDFNNKFSYGVLKYQNPSYLYWLSDGTESIYNLFYLYENKQNTKFSKISKEITLYSSMDFNKTSAEISNQIMSGMIIKLKSLNDTLRKKHTAIHLDIRNDNYQPNMTLSNIQNIIQHSKTTPIICCPVGTPNLESYQELIQNQSLMTLFPISGGNKLRQRDYENIVYFRPSFINEAKMLIEYAIKEKKCYKLAIYYQNDSYGNGAVNGVRELIKNHGLDCLFLPYQCNNPNITNVVNAINEFMPDSILFISTFVPAMSLVHQLGISQLSRINLFAISYAANHLYQRLAFLGLPLIRTHLVPHLNSKLEIIDEYHYFLKHSNIPIIPSDESLEGFIGMSLIEDMYRFSDGNLTPYHIKLYLSQLKNVNFKGLLLDFNPNTREIYQDIWIEKKD